MSFGPSGVTDKTQMVGGDPAVAWVNKTTLMGHAEDYYLDAKSQCAGVRGSCPDERLGGVRLYPCYLNIQLRQLSFRLLLK